jgi:hypothetical protein
VARRYLLSAGSGAWERDGFSNAPHTHLRWTEHMDKHTQPHELCWRQALHQ